MRERERERVLSMRRTACDENHFAVQTRDVCGGIERDATAHDDDVVVVVVVVVVFDLLVATQNPQKNINKNPR